MENNNEIDALCHYGVKGMKWGVINENDSQETRLAYEKNRMKYDFQNRESKMFYKTQNKKDTMEYKKAIKLAKIEKQIEHGKDSTQKAISNDERLGKKYKARAQAIAAVSAALAVSSVGNSISSAIQSKNLAYAEALRSQQNMTNVREKEVPKVTEKEVPKITEKAAPVAKQEVPKVTEKVIPAVKQETDSKKKLYASPDLKLTSMKPEEVNAGKKEVLKVFGSKKEENVVILEKFTGGNYNGMPGYIRVLPNDLEQKNYNDFVKNVSDVLSDSNRNAPNEKSIKKSLSDYAAINRKLQKTKLHGFLKQSDYEEDYICVGDTPVSELESLTHWGVLGMRWGIRKYQNEDGTLTEAGKIRYYGRDKYRKQLVNGVYETLKNNYNNSEDFKKATKEEKDKKYSELKKRAEESAKIFDEEADKIEAEFKAAQDVNRYANDKINTGKDILYTSSDLFGKASNLVPNVRGKESHPDYSSLSTEELRRMTDRLNAESNYARVSGQMIYTPSKQEITRERLQTIGAVLGIAGTVVGGIVLPLARTYQGFAAPGGKKKD